jgi:pimeloyl-ACP methyl ester carboxylesterase
MRVFLSGLRRLVAPWTKNHGGETMDYCITVRAPNGEGYGDEPGKAAFLAVPSNVNDFETSQAMVSSADWVRAVLSQIEVYRDATGVFRRDLLVFIHGFNNTPSNVLARHRSLMVSLREAGYRGGVVSFDWPSGDVALAYVNDREKAKQTAFALVRDCIELFARAQAINQIPGLTDGRTTADPPVGCDVNVHLLAHSTGAYVVQEAFDDADDRRVIASINWTVSQIAFISADISASSLAQGDSETESIFRHCVRFTNYSNPFDQVLQLSNVKRAGLSPRVGRVGLPSNAPPQAVNVECGEYYQQMIKPADDSDFISTTSHSWQIGDPVFSKDLAYTLNGDLDRRAIPTRKPLLSGQFELIKPTGTVQTAPDTPVPVVLQD